MVTGEEILAKLEQLRELSPEAALEVQKGWPTTLNALRGGINPIRSVAIAGVGLMPLETLMGQLEEHLDEAIGEATPA